VDVVGPCAIPQPPCRVLYHAVGSSFGVRRQDSSPPHPRPVGSSWSHAASSSASAWARSGIAASSTRCHLLGVPPLPQQCARSAAHGGRRTGRTGHEDEISTAIGEGKRQRRWRFGIRRRDCGSCVGGKGNRDVNKRGGVIKAG
jgi:hypothetical protein